MGGTIYCLVDVCDKVHTKDGAESQAEVAASVGLNEGECQKYRFDLASRRVLVDRGTLSSGIAA